MKSRQKKRGKIGGWGGSNKKLVATEEKKRAQTKIGTLTAIMWSDLALVTNRQTHRQTGRQGDRARPHTSNLERKKKKWETSAFRLCEKEE